MGFLVFSADASDGILTDDAPPAGWNVGVRHCLGILRRTGGQDVVGGALIIGLYTNRKDFPQRKAANKKGEVFGDLRTGGGL